MLLLSFDNTRNVAAGGQKHQHMEPSPVPADGSCEPDMHHKEFFSFQPALFLADLSNIALDYSISGIHQLERAIHESPLFQQPADSSLAPNCPAVEQQINEQLLQFKAAVSEVLAELQRRTADSVNRAAENFERYEAVTNLHVPPELYVQQPLPAVPEAVDASQEAQLDEELQQLRQQVQQAQSACRQLKQHLMHIDKDLSQAAARSAAFKPLADVVAAQGQPLLEEAAAIGALAAKLQPLVQRAQQLQQERVHPVGAAAAASAGGGMLGGGAHGAGAAAAAGDEAAAADSAAAEQQVLQLMAETGADLQQLKQLNALLGPAGTA